MWFWHISSKKKFKNFAKAFLSIFKKSLTRPTFAIFTSNSKSALRRYSSWLWSFYYYCCKFMAQREFMRRACKNCAVSKNQASNPEGANKIVIVSESLCSFRANKKTRFGNKRKKAWWYYFPFCFEPWPPYYEIVSQNKFGNRTNKHRRQRNQCNHAFLTASDANFFLFSKLYNVKNRV